MKPLPIVALIDADTLVYEACSATEQSIQWDDTLSTLHGFADEAFEVFQRKVQSIKEKVEADKIVLALSAPGQRWREKYLSTYKAHRVGARKPVHFWPLRALVEETYNGQVFIRPMLEADDVLGILVTHPTLAKGQKIVVSIDKDMKTLPGSHYNYAQEVSFEISESEADYHHLMQTLSGDATDGYSGCPGVGPKGAAKILDSFCLEDNSFAVRDAWLAVVDAFAKKELSEEVALQNARVARICRHTDYDFKKKEVILWQPPK